MQHYRYVIFSFIAGAILLAAVLQSATISGFAQFAIPDTRIGGLVTISTVVAVLGGIITFAALIRNQKAMKFVDETVNELTRVTWPTKDETTRATTTVVFTTLFVASLLGVYDFVWKNVADFFLFTEGF